MTIDKAKLKQDADTIFGNGAGLLMAIPAKDVRELLAEIERIGADRKACWEEFKVQGRQLDQLKAENEALRKDAERYRWLKAETAWGDEAIDAAMAKEASR